MNQAAPGRVVPEEEAFHFVWRRDAAYPGGVAQHVAQQPVPAVTDVESIEHSAFPDGRGPVRPDRARAYRTATLGGDGALPEGLKAKIILFNVVVALEWVPDGAYLEHLKAAFREASKLLFDVTDGYMAIDQVTFGAGPAWMNVADIQVLASNRLLPRSQVSGLTDKNKYRPILLGRGLWSKSEHQLHDWSEAYGVLIHEWGHYALGLKDQYLDTIDGTDGAALVVPAIDLLVNSIMAGNKQTELTGGPLANRRQALQVSVPEKATVTEWEQLRRRFPYLGIKKQHQPQAAPPPLDPIPSFVVDESAKGNAQVYRLELAALGLAPESLKHCWVYLRKRDSDPEVLIQQGVVGAGKTAIDLLGWAPGDEIILLLRNPDGDGLVIQGAFEADGDWRVTPVADAWPMVAVTYQGSGDNEANDVIPVGQPVWISVSTPRDAVRSNLVVSPLAERDPVFMVADLDGTVRLELESGASVIAQFSHGGSPDSGYPAHPNPIPSGSSEGNATIFFYDPSIKEPGDRRKQSLGDYRIVTTTNYHVPAPKWGEPRSYVFGVTTNRPLTEVADLRPTLILAFDGDQDGEQDGEQGADLQLCRSMPESGTWEPVPGSTTFDDRSFIAAPLNPDTARGLFAPKPYPEFFRLLKG